MKSKTTQKPRSEFNVTNVDEEGSSNENFPDPSTSCHKAKPTNPESKRQLLYCSIGDIVKSDVDKRGSEKKLRDILAEKDPSIYRTLSASSMKFSVAKPPNADRNWKNFGNLLYLL